MKIAMLLLDGYYPPDPRVEREAKTLVACGHEVWIFAKKKEDQKKEDICDNIHISRIDVESVTADAGLPKKAANFFSMRNLFLEKVILQHSLSGKFEVLHVHDFPLLPSAVRVGKRAGIPVLFDRHENYPDIMKIKKITTFRRLLEKCCKPSWRYRTSEYRCLNFCRFVFIVNESMRRKLIKHIRCPEHIRLIRNFPDLEEFAGYPMDGTVADMYKQQYTICYHSLLSGDHRGIDTVIEAFPDIKKSIPDAHLLIVGGGKDQQKYQSTIDTMGLTAHCTITGIVPYSKVKSYLCASDVCLVTYNKTAQTEAALPNKIFMYWACGKPVIVSDIGELRMIVNGEKAGLTVPPSDPIALTEAILRLHANREMADAMGRAGYAAVEREYNWRQESKTLIKSYEELALNG